MVVRVPVNHRFFCGSIWHGRSGIIGAPWYRNKEEVIQAHYSNRHLHCVAIHFQSYVKPFDVGWSSQVPCVGLMHSFLHLLFYVTSPYSSLRHYNPFDCRNDVLLSKFSVAFVVDLFAIMFKWHLPAQLLARFLPPHALSAAWFSRSWCCTALCFCRGIPFCDAVISKLKLIKLTLFDCSLQKLEANLRARAILIFQSVTSLLGVAFCVRFCATIAFYGKNFILKDTASADFWPCSYFWQIPKLMRVPASVSYRCPQFFLKCESHLAATGLKS